MSEIEDLNQKYRRQIRPIMEMLKHRKPQLNDTAWIKLVRKTESDIINSSDQYLTDLPQKAILDLVIHRLFNEFLDESI